MKDTTGRPSLRPARILYHPYKFDGQWKVGRTLVKTVPRGMTASDVMLPGEAHGFDSIAWEYEKNMTWARRLGLTSLSPDFMGMVRRGVAGVRDYLFPIPSRNHRFVIETDSDLDNLNVPRSRVASNILPLLRPGPSSHIHPDSHEGQELPCQDHPTHSNALEIQSVSHTAARIAEHGEASAPRLHIPSSGQPFSSRHSQPAHASNGPSNHQTPAISTISTPAGPSIPAPSRSRIAEMPSGAHTGLLSAGQSSSSNSLPAPTEIPTASHAIVSTVPRPTYPRTIVFPPAQPPSASLNSQFGRRKLRGQPFIISWHRSLAPYPLTRPPTAEALRAELKACDLYIHRCTEPGGLWNPLTQVWMWGEKVCETGAEMGWIEVSKWHPHPQLPGYYLQADLRPNWVMSSTMAERKQADAVGDRVDRWGPRSHR